MKKILTLAAIAATMTFASNKASAIPPHSYPNVPLNISFTAQYSQEILTTNSAGTTVKSSSLQTVSFNNKSIIALINLFEGANIPAGSYLAWNPWDEEIYATNSSGFYYYPYNDLEIDEDGLTGQSARDLTTSAGTEKDLTAVEFEMDFGDEDYFYTYGNLGTLNWTYGTATGTNQPVTLSISINLQGSDDCYFEDNQAEVTSGKITGTGKGTDPTDQFPFWYNY
jgi:hypothetical protein